VKFEEVLRLARFAKVDHAKRFVHYVVPEVVRPARVIWNQAIGALFLLLAIYFLVYASTHRQNVAGMLFGIFLGSIMVFFGVASFLKARRASRS
jgi:predicted membrane channel-forming protein YqfA (hemolysin III family)